MTRRCRMKKAIWRLDGARIANFIIAILGLTSTIPVRAVDLTQCTEPLGMESGAIPDNAITASSSFDSGNVGPHHARLRKEGQGGAWCPKEPVTNDLREWLEIDLRSVHLITATGTQGRFGNGLGVEFATGYELKYWRPQLNKWVVYKDSRGDEVIKGNDNTYIPAMNYLDPPIWASKIRFLPYDHHMRQVCMRVELYGCNGTDGIVSYSMPQGDKRGPVWEFHDTIYDGIYDGELRRGLGLLTDGRKGLDYSKATAAGPNHFSKYAGWVGWRNDTRQGQPIEIKFEFDQNRQFSAVQIFCNNQFNKDTKVFSFLEVFFSTGGKWFNGEPIIYNHLEEKTTEETQNVTVGLHNRVGRFVKLRLHFSAKWMMISEIAFDSTPAYGNFTPEDGPEPTTRRVPPPAATTRSTVSLTTTTSRRQTDVFLETRKGHPPMMTITPVEPPVSTARHDDPAYVAIVIGVLTALILILLVAVFLVFSRHRQRKCFASPLNGKAPSHLGGNGGMNGGVGIVGSSTCATVEKGAALMAYAIEDDDRYELVLVDDRSELLLKPSLNYRVATVDRFNSSMRETKLSCK